MRKLRILLAAVLCVSLLAFAGCGGNNDTTDGNAGNDTVTEDNTNMGNDDGNNMGTDQNNNNDGSVVDDMENGAEDAVDDLENDARNAADDVRNAVDGDNVNGRTNYSKDSNVGQ